jgi:hypothetical protein
MGIHRGRLGGKPDLQLLGQRGRGERREGEPDQGEYGDAAVHSVLLWAEFSWRALTRIEHTLTGRRKPALV